MTSIRKEFGVTIPFEQGGVIGYAKTKTDIELDLDKPIIPQLEKGIQVSNIVEQVLFTMADADVRRALAEWHQDGNPDGGDEAINTVDVIDRMREALMAADIA